MWGLLRAPIPRKGSKAQPSPSTQFFRLRGGLSNHSTNAWHLILSYAPTASDSYESLRARTGYIQNHNFRKIKFYSLMRAKMSIIQKKLYVNWKYNYLTCSSCCINNHWHSLCKLLLARIEHFIFIFENGHRQF